MSEMSLMMRNKSVKVAEVEEVEEETLIINVVRRYFSLSLSHIVLINKPILGHSDSACTQ